MTRPLCRNCGREQATGEDRQAHRKCVDIYGCVGACGGLDLCWAGEGICVWAPKDWPAEVARLKERIAELEGALNEIGEPPDLARRDGDWLDELDDWEEVDVRTTLRQQVLLARAVLSRSRGGAAREDDRG